MAQLGNIPEIQKVKRHMEQLQQRGLIADWELPYENILTRLNAAIFFLTPSNEQQIETIWQELSAYGKLSYKPNSEMKLSRLDWRVQFEN